MPTNIKGKSIIGQNILYAKYLNIDDKFYINRRRSYINKFINTEKFVDIKGDGYEYIISKMVSTFCKSQYSHQIFYIIENYGFMEAMRLYKKVNRRLFKASDIVIDNNSGAPDTTAYNIKVHNSDRRDYIELATPIITAWTKNLYSKYKINLILKELYEKYYTESGKQHRLDTYNKNLKKAIANKKAIIAKKVAVKKEKAKLKATDSGAEVSDSETDDDDDKVINIKVNSDSEDSEDSDS